MNLPGKYKHIIFDFDETIATIEADWKVWYKTLGGIFKKWEPSFNTNQDYKVIESYQNDFFKKFGKKIKDEVDESVIRFESKKANRVLPIQRTIDLIKGLENKNLYIWSSNYSETVKRFLKKLGILEYFKKVVGREMVDFIKGDPDGFNKYFKDKGAKEEFLMVGNSTHDKEAAKNSGIEYLDVRAL